MKSSLLFFITFSFSPVPSNRKNWRLEKIGDSGTKPVILRYCWRCCSTTAAPPSRNSRRDNAAGILIIWWTSPPRILQIHSVNQFCTTTPFHVPISFFLSSSAPWNNYHHFPRFWDQLYGPLQLGLSTEMHLWFQFHVWLNWRISIFFGC